MNTSSIRVSKDLKELYTTPNTDSPPILATAVEDKLDHVVALILGPPDTPYHFGFYFFDLRFPQTYPNDPPKVKITTTDYGRTRFNPNLYADGKVCLSILGTWRGETTEVWRSSYSVAYVLNAIQSLIMNTVPYHNEPGYEEESIAKHTTTTTTTTEGEEEGGSSHLKRDPEMIKKEIAAYSNKILYENIRVAVCDVVDQVCSGKIEYFKAFIKREFLLRYETYLAICTANKELDGQQFQTMPFEYAGNVAEGKYDYTNLITRLQGIKQRLDEETEQWKQKGKELTARRSYISSTLKDEHTKLNQELDGSFSGFSGGPVSDDNAFVWEVTLFGPESTIYEEGMFKIEIIFNEDPNEIPRVRFLSNMFHPNISPSGYPWFNIPPGKQDSVEFLLTSCKKLLTTEPNASPATWVNEEAAKACFHKEEETRKQWKKKVRQLARQTMEE
eukprot:TRINITY_DN76918_c0_g1_i1.p1 TRINITY_DN76918_c0_g1~~TRINITY_DN76918_c0_g1_i1.p1  ORF type:complete len:445 (-),score=58.21 TRINITY_DN76918_c0_g1_i1:147-1481(-)